MKDSLLSRTQTLDAIGRLCATGGVRDFIISPGSRSAPLTTAFTRNPQLRCRIVIDERSAAYVALGLAQQTGNPVGLVCTSGTAALNYAPAVVEAHYQRIPLLVFTADRPPEWIDQQDNQSIHQQNLYEPHIRGSFQLPVDMSHPDAQWYAERIVAEAIGRATGLPPGPVHINAPFREPLYPQREPPRAVAPQAIATLRGRPTLSPAQFSELAHHWSTAGRRLIAVGLHPPDEALQQALRHLSGRGAVVIGDITSNLYPQALTVRHADALLGTRDSAVQELLAPELLVTMGGSLVSKYLKDLLRAHKPALHWHIDPAGAVVDTYQALTHLLVADPADVLTALGQVTDSPPNADLYAAAWLERDNFIGERIGEFLATTPFGEFQATDMVLRVLPGNGHLQIGNSMMIRYVNLIAYLPPGTRVNSNRGTSGIDGTVSTAVGAALATDALTTLLVGDLAFFYDRNGLWNAHLPPNLRIVLFNNHGGGIFNLISGPDQLETELRHDFFFTPQPLTARRTAEDHGLDYTYCDSATGLEEALRDFFVLRDRAAILEIETSAALNTQVFQKFKALVA